MGILNGKVVGAKFFVCFCFVWPLRLKFFIFVNLKQIIEFKINFNTGMFRSKGTILRICGNSAFLFIFLRLM